MPDNNSLLLYIDELLEMATTVRLTHRTSGPVYEHTPTLSRSLFSQWKSQCMVFLQDTLGNTHILTEAFNKKVRQAHFYDVDEGEGILVAVKKEIERGKIQAYQNTQPLNQILLICNRFHLVVSQLGNRHAQRSTFTVADEYDVQDLLHALLRLFFEDIRPEEWAPSYAGKSSRMDFLLKGEQIVIEVKHTRDGLSAKEVGTQLIEDIARYKTHQDCRMLVCFVYDPEGRIINPRGLEKDLSRKEQTLEVHTIIIPNGY